MYLRGNMRKKISTSICVTPERKERLIAAARFFGVPVSDVLAVLIRKTRLKFRQNSATLWKAVEYQSFNRSEEYLIWHVCLEPRCYEFGVSQRLVFKVSVSLMYNVAIDLFLDKLLENGLDSQIDKYEINTNYFNARYNVHYKRDKTDEFWTICWDLRLKKEETT